MHTPAAVVRFVGMLSCGSAEAAACARMRAIEARCPVSRWDVCMQPPLPAWPGGGYAARVQAWLADGSVIAIRAQSAALLDALRDAFEGVETLLLREQPRAGWTATRADRPALPA